MPRKDLESRRQYAAESRQRNRIKNRDRERARVKSPWGWPCPICSRPLASGGQHFTRIHGMTAHEVRKAYGPTSDPSLTRLRSAEVQEFSGRHFWTEDEILKAVRSYTKRNGSVPTAGEWRKTAAGRPNRQTVVRKFGSWNKMLIAAGLLTWDEQDLHALRRQRMSITQVRRWKTRPPPRRKACSHGHRLTRQNTYIDGNGHRRCRTCNREKQARRRRNLGDVAQW